MLFSSQSSTTPGIRIQTHHTIACQEPRNWDFEEEEK